MGKFVSMPHGHRYGSLVVQRRGPDINGHTAYHCKCDCGSEVLVKGVLLRRGAKKTCNLNGHNGNQNRIPGVNTSELPEYQVWKGMLKRCERKNHRAFANYGGRGITVCDRWKSFVAFYEDMGKRPSLEHTLERKDVNGHYEPGNCKWATIKEQNRNTRNTIRVTYEGRKVALADLVEELGLSRSVVKMRLQYGWPLDVALSLPLQSSYHKRGRPRKKPLD